MAERGERGGVSWFKEPFWQGWLRGHKIGRSEHRRDAYYDILARLYARQRALPEGESLVELGKIIAMVEGLMPPAPEAPPRDGAGAEG